MDNIGDIIYVLLVIGAVIGSLIKKSREHRPVPPVVSDDEEEKADFPESLQELFKPPVPPAPKPPTVRKVADNKVVNATTAKKRSGLTSRNTSRQDVELESIETEPIIELEDADWRKAILYSEIINRPRYMEL